MTGLVSGLERQGYIKRKPLRSSRVIEAKLTAVGRRVFDLATERVHQVETELTSRLTKDEAETLRSLLERCVRALEGTGHDDMPDDEGEGLPTRGRLAQVRE
jgi:DNA-binding MarR family transcriptional regulator